MVDHPLHADEDGDVQPVVPCRADDTVTSIEFDPTGDHVLVGDANGRVVGFRNLPTRAFGSYHYVYAFELASFDDEVDVLKSQPIPPAIVKARLLRTVSQNRLLMLASNVKTTKLWSVRFTKPGTYERFKCLRVFARGNQHDLHSLSVNSEQEYFITSDPRHVTLWHVESAQTCYRAIHEPSEDDIIMKATFHPTINLQVLYGTCLGNVRMCDLRETSRFEGERATTTYTDAGRSSATNTLFTDVVSCVGDVMYSPDGSNVIVRDYMHIKVWDVRMPGDPYVKFDVHDSLRSRFIELYDNDHIFDRFGACVSPDGRFVCTGTYGDTFRMFDTGTPDRDATTMTIHKQAAATQQQPRVRSPLSPIEQSPTKKTRIDYDFRLSHFAWHPTAPIVACGVRSSLHFYGIF
jgi:serine/threonine-protein phosphatase 2A regulatory subunit B